jgi:phage shock protein C
MFCSHCGKEAEFSARFCSACGASLTRTAQRQGKIVRPRSSRIVAGVCSGLALYYGWDLALVRVLTLVFIVMTSGLGVVAYLAAWIVLPESQYALNPGSGKGTVV